MTRAFRSLAVLAACILPALAPPLPRAAPPPEQQPGQPVVQTAALPDVPMYRTLVHQDLQPPDNPPEIVTGFVTDLPAGIELDLRVAAAVDWPVSGFTPDPEYPDVYAGSFWEDWLRYWLWGEVPIGHRVFCGVEVPEFSADPELANEAAESIALEPESTDAEEICNEILEWVIPP